MAGLLLHNARIVTLDSRSTIAEALSVEDGVIQAVGDFETVRRAAGVQVPMIDCNGRTVIPGLNDSHIHLIRGGLSFNQELRWEGVASIHDGLRMIQEQAQRTPPPQWVRVVGGWTEWQFAERCLPTLAELNAAAPDTPVFLLHLYDRALLNAAALRAVGYGKHTSDPPGGVMERDRQGNPTGLLIANPNAWILYSMLALGPKLTYEDQRNSTRHFMRELNRLGVTSIIDAGGGFHYYPEDYRVIEDLHHDGQLTLRIAYNLFAQKPGHELEQFREWTGTLPYGQGDAHYRANGAGEMLVFSASDFEDFRIARPQLGPGMEPQLEAVVRHLAAAGWPFRLHATYDESISRALNVFERVHRDIPLTGLRWLFDHAETISDRNIDRVAALGGGIAIQHRMAFQGEYFQHQYGSVAAARTPPVRRMLSAGLPVGGGTDATRVASYHPFVALRWLVSGRTVGGTAIYPEPARLNRLEALRIYTAGSSWFSGEDHLKGKLQPGHYADLAVLSDDYLTVADEQIASLESVLTMVGGNVVYAAREFTRLGPPDLLVSPDWSPRAHFESGPAAPRWRVSDAAVCRHSGPVFGAGCACFAF